MYVNRKINVLWDWIGNAEESLGGKYGDFQSKLNKVKTDLGGGSTIEFSYFTCTGKFKSRDIYFAAYVSPLKYNNNKSTQQSNDLVANPMVVRNFYYMHVICSYKIDECKHESFTVGDTSGMLTFTSFCPASLNCRVDNPNDILPSVIKMLGFFENMDECLFKILTVKMIRDVNQLRHFPRPEICFHDFTGEWFVTYVVPKSSESYNGRLLSLLIAPNFESSAGGDDSGSGRIGGINGFNIKVVVNESLTLEKSGDDPKGTQCIRGVQDKNLIIGTIREYADVYRHVSWNGFFTFPFAGFSAFMERPNRISFFSWLSENFYGTDVFFQGDVNDRLNKFIVKCTGCYDAESGISFVVYVLRMKNLGSKGLCQMCILCGYARELALVGYSRGKAMALDVFNIRELDVINQIKYNVDIFKQMTAELLDILTTGMFSIWPEKPELNFVYFNTCSDWFVEYLGSIGDNGYLLKIVAKCSLDGKVSIKSLQSKDKKQLNALKIDSEENPSYTKVGTASTVRDMVNTFKSNMTYEYIEKGKNRVREFFSKTSENKGGERLFSEFHLLEKRVDLILSQIACANNKDDMMLDNF